MKFLVTGGLLAVLVCGGFGPMGVPISLAASTFIGTTVLDVGPDGRAVTVRTNKGESLSLVVADPAMMKGVEKGDQVSLELGPDDRVNKIVKVGEPTGPKPSTGKSSDEY